MLLADTPPPNLPLKKGEERIELAGLTAKHLFSSPFFRGRPGGG